ncbi:hypothetical protein ACFLV5_03670, partial [Chloroflexota bacterium]
RLGKPQEEHLKLLESEYLLVLLDSIANKLGETLSKEKRTLETEKLQIDNILSNFSDLLLSVARVKALSSEFAGIKTSLSQTLYKVEEIKLKLTKIEDYQERNRKRLLEAQSAGAFKRFLTGLQPEKIQHEIDRTSIHIDSITRTLETNTELQKSLETSCRVKEIELNQAITEVNNSLKKMKMTEAGIEEQKHKYEVHHNYGKVF